ncbi:MAG: hypothetical protein NTZ67_06650 [Gammaproteobacteria bacterium]|nr:hypothetical protein [Gammaproteobacteria bacterium]
MIILWILFGMLGRLVIHIPNVTPLTSLCLLAPSVFSRRNSFLIILSVLFLSDLCLHFIFHYAVFGYWTLFNYSGWLAVILFGFFLGKNPGILRALSFTLYSSFLFWLWTNFGTWCTTTIYAHTTLGLMNCYIAALPFLRNAAVGSLLWTTALILMLRVCYAPFANARGAEPNT